MTKTLALKTMYGLMGVGATVGSVFYIRSQLSYSDTDPEVEKLSVGELLGKVGLDCGIERDEELTDSKDCSVKENGSINVKVGEKREEGVSFSSTTTSKLKVSKEEGYPKNLKFVVDSGDLELSKGSSAATNIPKLEQFETYEIKREGGKFYLGRKLGAKEGKKDALGLPSSCTLPKEGNSECTLGIEEIKGVKFDNHNEGVRVSNGDVQLKISGVKDTTSFPENYKFTFTFPQEVTINNKKIKGNIPTDFKIKKKENSNTLTLERAWTADGLGKKVGLSCSNDTECTIEGNSLKVKQDDKKDTNLTKNSSGSGKIKVEKDQAGYNQGFKFTISDGNISLSGGTKNKDEEKIKHLEEFESYEIKEDGDKWFLVRKNRAEVFIKKALNIGSFCSSYENFPGIGENGSITCNISDPNKLKDVNFENKNHTNWPTSKNIRLEIERDTNNGFKFTFAGCSGSSCSLPGSTNAAKDNSGNFIYQIKKDEKSGNLSLEPKKSR